MDPVTPVSRHERISSVDVLRGFALLGILLMNIVGFAMHHAAYDDPTVAGGSTGINLWVWITMHILAEGKMRCLFSMVFGASLVLLTSRFDSRSPASGADIFLRRNMWLLLLGIVHAYLLWQGEILYPYALCAFVLYPLRKLPARTLLLAGGALVLLLAATNIYMAFDTRNTIALAQAADAAEKAGRQPSEAQEEARKEWAAERKWAKPTPQELARDRQQWQGNLFSVLKARAVIVSRWHSLSYYHFMNWDIWSMMLLGMGLFKLGVFNAERSIRFYASMAAAGYLIGGTVNSFTAWVRVQSNFDLVTRWLSGTTYDIGRLAIALAHVGILLVFVKKGWFSWLTSRLAAVGQMALSNYLFQSVVCSTIFCGYGFGLYGRLERYQLYYVVAALWIFQMIVSPIWLRYYRFGPAEWLWRSLTYWKKQPMRIAEPEPALSQTA